MKRFCPNCKGLSFSVIPDEGAKQLCPRCQRGLTVPESERLDPLMVLQHVVNELNERSQYAGLRQQGAEMAVNLTETIMNTSESKSGTQVATILYAMYTVIDVFIASLVDDDEGRNWC